MAFKLCFWPSTLCLFLSVSPIPSASPFKGRSAKKKKMLACFDAKHASIFFSHSNKKIEKKIVVCAEEPAYCDLLNAQGQAPDIQAANGEEKATCFQRATDSKVSLNESVPAAESSPWRPTSLSFTFFETHYQFTVRWFRQITPLGIRNARSLGTYAIPKAPRLAHTVGALDPMPQTTPHLFQWAAEVALGISFNAQSQAPDIPGASSSALLLRHTAPLQVQFKTPDIRSLRAYSEEFLTSLNSQTQAPDDPSQTFSSDFHWLSLRAYMEELSASFNTQDQAPDDLHTQDRQCAPYIFVDYPHHGRPELVRFTTKQNVSHPSFQLVSQDSARELFNRLMTCPIGVFRGLSFMCVIYGFQLFVKVWIVFIVLALGVLGLLR